MFGVPFILKGNEKVIKTFLELLLNGISINRPFTWAIYISFKLKIN